jgi:hypothetical protein
MTLSACRVRVQYKWFTFLGVKFSLFDSNFKEELDSKDLFVKYFFLQKILHFFAK